MKKTIFGKFTIFWEYFHGNRYYGKILLLSQGLNVQILQNILRNLVAKFPSEHGNY
jgi:hypothetical protein